MNTLVIEGCAVVTMDGRGTEYGLGHVVVTGNAITSVGAGSAPPAGVADSADGGTIRRIDGSGCLATPGLINTHHHLYQWGTRGMAADATLFEWLTELYPVWARMDADIVRALATAALAWLARSGCATTMDHHYVFPRSGGDVLGATIAAARQVGLRFHPTRGSMDLGASSGGLPPDEVVEDRDAILVASKAAIEEFHDPSPQSMLRMGLAPCSPFSVTSDLLTEAAGAGPGSQGAPAHASSRDGGGERVLRRAFRLHTGGVSGRTRLAGRGRLARARGVPGRRGHLQAGRDGHRSRALPVLQWPAGRRDLPDA